LLVVDSNRNLLGTVTDGDIRRALLNGFTFSDMVEKVMFCYPVVVSDMTDLTRTLELMRLHKLRQLPIVNNIGSVVGLHVWEDLIAPPSKANYFMIMAGGLGKRLHPLTSNFPKPLLKVAGKPILERIIDQAKESGFVNILMSIHFKGELIKDYFGDGKRFGVNIEYIHENKPLGTAGSLGLLKNVPDLPIIITNGDVLADVNFNDILDFHQKCRASASMVVHRYDWQHPFGVVKLNGIEIAAIEEKPIKRTNVNSGIYVLNPEVIKTVKADKRCDMPDIFKKLMKTKEKVVAFPMHEDWLDLGCHADLSKAKKKFEKIRTVNDK
jgi:NDP-sugar pyrophosphorylase family protein